MTPGGAENPQKLTPPSPLTGADNGWHERVHLKLLPAMQTMPLVKSFRYYFTSSLHTSTHPLLRLSVAIFPLSSQFSNTPFPPPRLPLLSFSHPSTPPYFLSPLIFSPDPASVLRGCNDRLWNKGGSNGHLDNDDGCDGEVAFVVVVGRGGVSVDSPCLSRHQSGSQFKAEVVCFSYFLSSRHVRSTLWDWRSTQCAPGYTGACVGSGQAVSMHFHQWGTWKRFH